MRSISMIIAGLFWLVLFLGGAYASPNVDCNVRAITVGGEIPAVVFTGSFETDKVWCFTEPYKALGEKGAKAEWQVFDLREQKGSMRNFGRMFKEIPLDYLPEHEVTTVFIIDKKTSAALVANIQYRARAIEFGDNPESRAYIISYSWISWSKPADVYAFADWSLESALELLNHVRDAEYRLFPLVEKADQL